MRFKLIDSFLNRVTKMVTGIVKFFLINFFVFVSSISISAYGGEDTKRRLSLIYDAYINHDRQPNTDKIVRVLEDRKKFILMDESVEKSLTEFLDNIDRKFPNSQNIKKRFKGVYEDTFRGCAGTKLNTDFSSLFFLAEIMNSSIELSSFDGATKTHMKSNLKEFALDMAKNVKGFEGEVTLMDLISLEGIEAFESQFMQKSGLHLFEID